MFKKILAFLKGGHWDVDAAALPPVKRFPLRLFRFFTMSWNAFSAHRGKLHAAALTYFTLTTVVPVLCLVILAAKYLGLGEFARKQINVQMESAIERFEADARAAAEFSMAEAEKAAAAATNKTAAAAVPAAAASAAPDAAGTAAPAAETPAAPEHDALAEALQKRDEARAKLKIAQDFAQKARETSNKIFDQIRDFDIGTLGVAGLVLLVWAVICTLGSVEQSFNDVWDIPRPRSTLRKLWYYLLILAVLPVLVCAASAVPLVRALSGVILSYVEYIPYADCITGIVRMVIDSPVAGMAITLVASALSFAFFLWAMPNTKTRFGAAFRSGLITCVLFGGWVKLCAVAQVGISKSSAIYGSFSLLPIILAWVYVSWEIVLLGAAFSRVFQNGTDKPLGK